MLERKNGLKFKGGLEIQVVFNCRFCLWEAWFGLTWLIEMYMVPCCNNAYKIFLHTTTYLIIFPEPLETPPQKFYHH